MVDCVLQRMQPHLDTVYVSLIKKHITLNPFFTTQINPLLVFHRSRYNPLPVLVFVTSAVIPFFSVSILFESTSFVFHVSCSVFIFSGAFLSYCAVGH